MAFDTISAKKPRYNKGMIGDGQSLSSRYCSRAGLLNTREALTYAPI